MNEKVILLAQLYGKLPQYKCHKVVSAGKITRLYEAHGMLRVECEALEMPVVIPLDFMQRHAPEVGGYLVLYRDGYLSYSPAEAFEAGYSAFDPEVERFHADTNRRAAKLINEIMSRDTDKSEGQQCGDDEETPEDEGQEGFASFSAALTWLKEGRKIARASWPNYKYVYLYTRHTKTYGGVVTDQLLQINARIGGGSWTPSSEELLATDWMVVTSYRMAEKQASD